MGSPDQTVITLLGLIMSFLMVWIVVAIALYLLKSFGLYGMARKAGLEESWIAFIPIVDVYLIGKIIKEIRLGSIVIPSPEIVLIVAPLIYLAISWIPVIGFLGLIALIILEIAAMYALFRLYKDDATLLTVICTVFPVVYPIILFTLREQTPNNLNIITANNNRL